MPFNIEAPCRAYGLQRLVIAASACANLNQLLGREGDGAFPQEWYLPVWGALQTRMWAAVALPGVQLDDEAVREHGLAVPGLVRLWRDGLFAAALNQFIERFSPERVAARRGRGFAGDALRMVLLQGSEELREDAVHSSCGAGAEGSSPSNYSVFAGGGHPGDFMGFASTRAEHEVRKLLTCPASINRVVDVTFALAPHVFEWMVLNAATQAGGLRLTGRSARQDAFLKFSGECELWSATQIKPGLLFRPRGNYYPAIDACGIPAEASNEFSNKFVLIQATEARERSRIPENVVQRFPVPRGCNGIVCLYIVPTAPSVLHLSDNSGAVRAVRAIDGKAVEEVVLAASSVLAGLPREVVERFLPFRHMQAYMTDGATFG